MIHRRSTIYAIIGLGLLLRVIALVVLVDYPTASDSIYYKETAIRLLDGERFEPFWPPGLPYFLTTVYSVFGVSAWAERGAMIAFYVLLALSMYWLTRDLFGYSAANLAVLILSMYPNYIFQSVTALTQLPVAACLMIVVYATFRLSDRRNVLKLVVIGLALAIATLFRPSSLMLLGFIPLYILYRHRRMLMAVMPILVASMVIGVHIAYVYSINQNFMVINYANSYNLWLGNNEYTPMYRTWLLGTDRSARPHAMDVRNWEIETQPPTMQDRLYRQDAIDHILDRPDLFALRSLNRARAYWGFDTIAGTRLIVEDVIPTIVGVAVIAVDALFYLVVMIPALLLMINHRRDGLPLLLIGGVVLVYAAPYVVSFAHPTYRVPVLPLMMVLSAGYWLQDEKRVVYPRMTWAVLGVFGLIQVEWAAVMLAEFMAGY